VANGSVSDFLSLAFSDFSSSLSFSNQTKATITKTKQNEKKENEIKNKS
jgi:hypothetical protein